MPVVTVKEHEFELVGGHPVLDLTNTVSWRPVPAKTVDRLADFPAALRWATAAGVLDAAAGRRLAAADPADAARALARLTGLRDRLYAVLAAVPTQRTPDLDTLTALHNDLSHAIGRAEPAAELPLRWTVDARQPADLVDLMALQADELLRSTELDRLGQCADDGCGWLFLDRTRSRTRRWCSSADCGNRERARRHYARKQP
ncbi:MAG: hypothetical protein GEV07_04680 [Streptosporangiales bacterium]|nr:hypothetical protein [Streptosporangiales bacterium]